MFRSSEMGAENARCARLRNQSTEATHVERRHPQRPGSDIQHRVARPEAPPMGVAIQPAIRSVDHKVVDHFSTTSKPP